MASPALVRALACGVSRREELGAHRPLAATPINSDKFQQDLGQQQGCGPHPSKQRPSGEAYVRPGQPTAAATWFLPGGQAFSWPSP